MRVYLTKKEVEFLKAVFNYGNWGCEGPNEDELTRTRDSILKKIETKPSI